MKNTYFSPHPQEKNIAKAHFGDREIPLWDLGIFAATGGLRSSLSDMMRYVKAQLGMTHQDTLLGRAIVRSHEKIGDVMAYGIGKGSDDNGLIWLNHNGGTAGSNSRILLNPDQKQGGILLTNNSLEKNLDLLYPALIHNNEEREKLLNELTPEKLLKVSEKDLDPLKGPYKGEEGAITVEVQKDGTLLLNYTNTPLAKKTGGFQEHFYPSSKHTFYSKATDSVLKFQDKILRFGKCQEISSEEKQKALEDNPKQVFEDFTKDLNDEDLSLLPASQKNLTFEEVMRFEKDSKS